MQGRSSSANQVCDFHFSIPDNSRPHFNLPDTSTVAVPSHSVDSSSTECEDATHTTNSAEQQPYRRSFSLEPHTTILAVSGQILAVLGQILRNQLRTGLVVARGTNAGRREISCGARRRVVDRQAIQQKREGAASVEFGRIRDQPVIKSLPIRLLLPIRWSGRGGSRRGRWSPSLLFLVIEVLVVHLNSPKDPRREQDDSCYEQQTSGEGEHGSGTGRFWVLLSEWSRDTIFFLWLGRSEPGQQHQLQDLLHSMGKKEALVSTPRSPAFGGEKGSFSCRLKYSDVVRRRDSLTGMGSCQIQIQLLLRCYDKTTLVLLLLHFDFALRYHCTPISTVQVTSQPWF